jgi:hypothetical protein
MANQAVEEEIIPITRQIQPPPPKVVYMLVIVDDINDIIDELQIEDTEAKDKKSLHL